MADDLAKPTAAAHHHPEIGGKSWLSWSRDGWPAQYHRNQIELIHGLDLSSQEQLFLEYRWLDEVDWIEKSAVRNLRLHQILRIVAIVGGAAISGLVGYGVTGQTTDVYRLVTFVLTLAVTASVALDEFFRFGDRWRQQRVVVEVMRSEGALYFALAGPYRNSTHTKSFPAFAASIERLARDDVKEWVTAAVTGGGSALPGRADDGGGTTRSTKSADE